MTENSNIYSLPMRRTEQNSMISRSMYTCFKIVNKLKSELLSYIIFEFFYVTLPKIGRCCYYMVSKQIRIIVELFISKYIIRL